MNPLEHGRLGAAVNLFEKNHQRCSFNWINFHASAECVYFKEPPKSPANFWTIPRKWTLEKCLWLLIHFLGKNSILSSKQKKIVVTYEECKAFNERRFQELIELDFNEESCITISGSRRAASEGRVCDLRRSITHKCWPSSLWNVVFTWKMRVPYLPAPAWCHPICCDNYWPDRYFRGNISRQAATLILILQHRVTLNVITWLFINGFHCNWNCSIAGKRLYRKSFGLDSIKGSFRRQICISRERGRLPTSKSFYEKLNNSLVYWRILMKQKRSRSP